MGAAIRKEEPDGEDSRDNRAELIAQLYYDRAEAARLDPAAARMIDMAISMLLIKGVSAVADFLCASPVGERNLH